MLLVVALLLVSLVLGLTLERFDRRARVVLVALTALLSLGALLRIMA